MEQQSLQQVSNAYMAQVMQEQAQVQEVFKAKRAPARARLAQAVAGPLPGKVAPNEGAEAPAVDVRITGWWRWRRVIVPPNAYVVHTRLGEAAPLHCGLGVSFPFDPYTDSFLVVPAAMQTIMISANCICRERQGILVQGYVQWIIDDFATAYRKLDFSDPVEPMKVVNLQLREQAEAAIKDTVAVMSIDDVLADKQPIVKVLTTRLRQLAEGDGKEGGLGLSIITVQLKEAVVSSTRVWESLQRPFRAERQKTARLAELEHEGEVHARESSSEAERDAIRVEAEAAMAKRRAEADAVAFDRAQAERVRRARLEAEALAESQENEQSRLRSEAALARARLETALAEEELREEAAHRAALRQVELLRARRAVENDVSPGLLQTRLLESLPQVAERLPRPQELKSVTVGGLDGLSPLVHGVADLLDRVRGAPAPQA